MPIATTRTGDELLRFQPGTTLVIPEELAHLPLEFAVALVRYRGESLLVFNPWRQEWEIPAGLVEPDESPEDAARRELAEESGQVASSLAYTGLCLLRLKKADRLEMGAVYTGALSEIRPFKANEESARLLFWDSVRPVEGYINELSIALIKQTSH